MAQAAVALAEENLPQPEENREIIATKEKPLDQAMENGTAENVIDLFRKDAKKKLETVERLGKVEPTDAVFTEIVGKIEAANDNARAQIGAAEDKAAKTLEEALGISAPLPSNETEAPPVAEEVKAMPVIAVGEEPATELVEAKEGEADPQLEAAAEVVKENYEALIDFCHEHGLKYDPETLKVDEGDLKRLSKVERLYVLVLLAKHAAGKASLEHAEAERASSPDAERLASQAVMTGAAAKALETTYMDLPEIQQIAGQSSNETGGSIGSEGFDGQPPASAPPAGPAGPGGQPPQHPILQGKGLTIHKEAPGEFSDSRIQTNIQAHQGPAVSGPVEKGFFGKLVSKIMSVPGSKNRH